MSFNISDNPLIQLNNGQQMPQLGLGVYKVQQDVAVHVVEAAIERGYRRIDTAALYDNEVEVGAGIRRSGVGRENVFVTTKIWNDRQGYDSALEAIDDSLMRLNIEYIDMLLIHWPTPAQGKFVETWAAFEKALQGGKIRGIGVSNFQPWHLDELVEAGRDGRTAGTVPAINQIELNPTFQQAAARAYNSAHGIVTEAWAPIARGTLTGDTTLAEIAAKHGKTPTQVAIRWHIQLSNLVIPKTTNPDRMSENIDVFDFSLDSQDMAAIEALETGERNGPDPDKF
jgi:2,5-diketo-D-gluconate reductase A